LTRNLRIIAGRLRGKKVHSVPGLGTRPTADRVREAVFNILGAFVLDARVLDLFSGTGALGIEALSRGAREVLFVESVPEPILVIQKNISECRLAAEARIQRWDLRREYDWPSVKKASFNLVLMDPPYDGGYLATTLKRLHQSGLLEKEALVVAEHSPREPAPEVPPFVMTDQRKYGKTLVSFWTYTP